MEERNCYLDNAAATRMDEAVLEAMKPYFFDSYSVATSEFGYSMGLEARDALNNARKILAEALGAQPEEFIFTSGATESSNLALKGAAKALESKKGKHIIVSSIEDFPVLNSAKSLEKQGFEIEYLRVDPEGLIDIEQLEKAITPKTALVSVQHANQEIGTIQDIKRIGEICKKHGTLFHTDATHTFMRVALDVREIPADLITVTAETLHGPKGVGGLYVRKGTPIAKIMDGGFQEFNLRGGAENIPGAVGFARAVQLVTEEENERLKEMRDALISSVFERIPRVTLNGHPEKRIPQNANITFHLVEGESITLHLDMYGISVSTGSACFSRSLEGSHVISAIGGDHERVHGSLRITFGRYNTMDDVEYTVAKLESIVKQLRAISPLGKQ